ncbi:uncharacterized protein METZ01_LOCUS141221, partial [marine metagenome]
SWIRPSRLPWKETWILSMALRTGYYGPKPNQLWLKLSEPRD